MPRKNNNRGRGTNSKLSKKNYNHKKRDHKGKTNYKHSDNRAAAAASGSGKSSQIDKNQKFKKFKHIRRNQESEEALRRQHQIEQKYNIQNKSSSEDESNEDLNENPIEKLISTFNKNDTDTKYNKKLSAIESSDSSDYDDMETEDKLINNSVEDINSNVSDDSEDNVDDDQQNCEAEENERDNEIDDDLSDSNDYLTDSIVLRPEENKTKMNKATNDYIENDSDNEDSEEEYNEEYEVNEINVNNDIFSIHLDNELSPKLFDCINSAYYAKNHELNWPKLGRLFIDIPFTSEDKSSKKKIKLLDDNKVFASEGVLPQINDFKNIDLNKLQIKSQIHSNIKIANNKILKNALQQDKILTPIQSELFSIMSNYQDLYYPNRNHQNGEEIRFTYCLHAVNHIIKTRAKILHHNAKLSKINNDKKTLAIIPDSYRDQGLFRPKILIIVPFRNSALCVINILIDLLFPKLGGTVMHHKRFLEEFDGESLYFPKRNPKPEDYEQTFAGNSDDTFRIGISLTKKCMKLYSDFYTSDILIASPLGLRMIIGAPGEKDRDYDFLASIELLILDQIDVFLAQNWDHLLHILDHLHLQPQSARNTDFSRVRTWCLNGWSRYYRQTLMFASHELPEFRSLLNSRCTNYRGKVRISNPVIGGSIQHIAVQIPQVFHRIDVTSIQSSFDERFNHFLNTILPQYKSSSMAHCLIYVPSYFDFVRIRNNFKKESINFVQICEYTKDEKIARARDMFFHSGAHFLLYSERAHFFRRTRIKGIRHLIMYQPPTWPHFYSEMVNFMQNANQNPRDGLGDSSMTVTILYSKYDMLQVASIVGSDRAAKMTATDKNTHMFMTDEN